MIKSTGPSKSSAPPKGIMAIVELPWYNFTKRIVV